MAKFFVNLTRSAIQSATVVVEIPDNELTEDSKQQAYDKACERSGDADWSTDDAELINDNDLDYVVFEDIAFKP